jgi:DNA-binding MarR family transcriptional regulator
MTTPDAYVQFGQTLAFAERNLTAVLRRHLAERGITPETWYAMKLVGSRGPGLARQALLDDLAGSPTLTEDAARQLVARLESEGMMQGEAELDLTPAGEAMFRDLQEYVLRPTTALLSQFDLDDIETTVRTLRAITVKAKEGVSVAQ